MKKFIGLCLLSLISLPVVATERQCMSRLTQGFSLDGQSFVVNLDEARIRDYGRDYTAQAISVVRAVLDKAGCRANAVNFGQSSFGRSKHGCHQLVGGRELSRTCYIETNLGSFIVTYDFMDNAYIIYKRWD